MRALFLIESLELAGAERVVVELSREGKTAGCEAHVVTLRETQGSRGSYRQGVPELPLFKPGKFRWPRSAPAAAMRLRSAVKRLKPDVMAVHAPRPAVIAALAGIRVPTLWVLHGHDICWDGRTLRRRLSRGLHRWALRRLGGNVAAVSDSLADRAAVGLGIDRDQISVIPNGINTRRFRFEDRTPSDEVVVCLLGRLIHAKGPRDALKAFGVLHEEFPAARLWFIGDGQMRAELEAEVATHGWNGAVTFWGMLERPDEQLRQATVMWMPSESEGLPVACLEAMATGVPVLGFDVRGVRDLLKDGCGVLVRPKDSKGLAQQTVKLVRDCQKYQGIARAARMRVEQQYSRDKMCNRHYELMRSLCNGNSESEARARHETEDIHAGATRY